MKVLEGAAFALAAAVFTTSLLRRFYGIDFSDESFYSALALRFAQGDQPFVDEYNLAQYSAAILSWPLQIWSLWLGTPNEGIVLFFRFVHLALATGATWLIYAALSPRAGRIVATCVALCALVFTPLNIQSASYITLGMLFFTAGCFLAVGFGDDAVRRHGWTGFLHGVACTTYPTLAVAAGAFIAFFFMPCRRYRAAGWYVSGAVVAALPALALLAAAGPENITFALRYATSIGIQGAGTDKLRLAYAELAHHIPSPGLLAFLAGVLVVVHWRPSCWTHRAGAVLPLAVLAVLLSNSNLWSVTAYPTGSMYLVVFSVLASTPFVIVVAVKRQLSPSLVAVCIASLIAGLVVFWSSGSGARMASLGLFPAFLTGLVAMVLYARRHAEKAGFSFAVRRALTCIPLLILSALAVNLFLQVYRDGPVPTLDARVERGPYRWLLTTSERRDLVHRLAADIETVAQPKDRVLVFDDFPAGYLIAGKRPATPTVWSFPLDAYASIDRTVNEAYYTRQNTRPSIVVRMEKIPRPDDPGLRYLPMDPLVRYVDEHYAPVLRTENYTIYRTK